MRTFIAPGPRSGRSEAHIEQLGASRRAEHHGVHSPSRRKRSLATSEALVALGAAGGAVGLATRALDFGRTINHRLPFDSPTFAGAALLAVVAIPMTIAARAAWRGSRERDVLAVGSGLLLVGWIVVEIPIIRSFSWLQPTFLLAGLAIAFTGYRQWRLIWGTTEPEVDAAMPGDEFIVAHLLTATRSITIAVLPCAVWPWLVQVGRVRADFYSHDWLDIGRQPSATDVLEEFQDCALGTLAAPMTRAPSPHNSFVVAWVDVNRSLVWVKRDSVWSWLLIQVWALDPDLRVHATDRPTENRSQPASPSMIARWCVATRGRELPDDAQDAPGHPATSSVART